MSKHVYTFANMNGKQCQVTTSTELSAELLAKYKEALGIACTHTEEPMGNDIAPPSREYDAAAAHIEALEAEIDEMKRDTSAIEAAVLRRVADEFNTYRTEEAGTIGAYDYFVMAANRIEKGARDEC